MSSFVPDIAVIYDTRSANLFGMQVGDVGSIVGTGGLFKSVLPLLWLGPAERLDLILTHFCCVKRLVS